MNKLPPSQLDKVLFGAIDLLNSGQQKFLSSLGNNSYELLVSHCIIFHQILLSSFPSQLLFSSFFCVAIGQAELECRDKSKDCFSIPAVCHVS